MCYGEGVHLAFCGLGWSGLEARCPLFLFGGYQPFCLGLLWAWCKVLCAFLTSLCYCLLRILACTSNLDLSLHPTLHGRLPVTLRTFDHPEWCSSASPSTRSSSTTRSERVREPLLQLTQHRLSIYSQSAARGTLLL